MSEWTEAALSELRDRVCAKMSEYRFLHTCGVERTAAELAGLYCPEQASMLCAAALLHDITKEYTDEQQLSLIAGEGITLRPDERESSKIWHGITAPIVIARDYPEFADESLLSAVRWHTTGHEGMTVAEAILYLADYIEEGRVIPACVALRRAFFDAEPEKMDAAAREIHLWEIMLRSLECTVEELTAKGAPICLDTAGALSFVKEKLTLLKGTK